MVIEEDFCLHSEGIHACRAFLDVLFRQTLDLILELAEFLKLPATFRQDLSEKQRKNGAYPSGASGITAPLDGCPALF